MLGLKFAYLTNGHGIVEFDFTTGKEQPVDVFPKPAELWQRSETRSPKAINPIRLWCGYLLGIPRSIEHNNLINLYGLMRGHAQ